MDYIKAFAVGGLICALVQILMDKTKLMPGRIMVLLVVVGTILGAVACTRRFWSGPEPGRAFPCWDLVIRCGKA